MNSPQTAVFDKGRLLYGLDRARKAIRSLDQAIIVEGYLDVIALHQAGFANAVSPMGTALNEHQLVLLKRFSRRIVLALDSDAAGNQAPCAAWRWPAGTLNMGRLAYCFARLYQETKDPLWKAKAEALVQGILEAQDPVTGFITPFGARNVLGGARIDGPSPSRDMGIAAAALATVPELLAEPKVSDKKAK